ncbi:hypothetical protein [Hymenobacter cavernae]|uniref:DUF4890 domain-containing protein n=1 Tax=Hymenobacter cavernae TaxID=2044852 RepID=A0ABQ1TQK5_9BACT|nr:hypothetical protein [Hymenobacter cavernae]GGE98822.1 hypothetical protein GCM10011383_07060 [Hymenobacter cavernae]
MKKLIAATSLAALLFIPRVQAQTSDSRSTSVMQGAPGMESSARKSKKKDSATDIARMQRRMSMNPDQVKRDQQMEILEARSGGTSNTSFGRAAGPARQFEKGNGGFTVRKFRDNRIGTARQKRGQTRPAPGIDPKGKPLVHKHRKKHHFLFF